MKNSRGYITQLLSGSFDIGLSPKLHFIPIPDYFSRDRTLARREILSWRHLGLVPAPWAPKLDFYLEEKITIFRGQC